jgi:hypothetical protein
MTQEHNDQEMRQQQKERELLERITQRFAANVARAKQSLDGEDFPPVEEFK